MYAHITNGVIDSINQVPPEQVFQDDRWWDLRPLDPEVLAVVGWYPVFENTRPADTATNTSEPVYSADGTTVTQTWQVVPKTPERIAKDLADSNANAILQLLTDTMPTLETITNTTNANMTGNTAAAAIKDLARANRRIIRLLTNNLSATN